MQKVHEEIEKGKSIMAVDLFGVYVNKKVCGAAKIKLQVLAANHTALLSVVVSRLGKARKGW
jgi:hypothetical protein